MDSPSLIPVAIVAGLIGFIFLSAKLITYLKMKNTNTALWGSVVDGLTQKVVSVEELKTPEIHMEKRLAESPREKEVTQ